MKPKLKLPPIGMRIVKSSVGVLLCFAVYLLRGKQGIPFYSMLAVLWCIQPYTGKTFTMAIQRTTGTLIGAVYGLISILLEIYVFNIYNTLAGYILTSVMIIPVIYTTIILHRLNASYFSCVVFLSITVMHIADANPFVFVGNRVLDTFIGIAAGLLINSIRLPRRKNKNVLFIAKLDDMLAPISEQLTPFSKVELNRMLDDGLKLTIVTMRTAASLMKPLEDVHINIPVIIMDGAALYDIKEKKYLHSYVISHYSTRELRQLLAENGMHCFINALCDGILVIYYEDAINDAERKLYLDLRNSPYRNYIKREPLPDDRIIYLMVIDETEKVNAFRKMLSEKGYDERFKILCYPSDDYKGYSYIKIYNKNACIENMQHYLEELTKVERSVIIGTDGKSKDGGRKGLNSIVKSIKNSFEPLLFKKQRM